jgi:tRNA1Val (adenine37-N6)-methyltransferase
MNQWTTDSLFNGRLLVQQSIAGYRFSIDAILLAGHLRPPAGTTIVDLGTGCGIIPLILAYRHADTCHFGIEVQPELAELAERNVRANHFEDRITILCQDMTRLPAAPLTAPVDIVISNPPYRKVDSGRINPHPQRAVARHELAICLRRLVETARRMLNPGGRLMIIYPAQRTTDLLFQMRRQGLEPKFMRTIHSSSPAPAKWIIVEGVRAAKPGLIVAAPLFVYRGNGCYSDEVERMFCG